MEVKVSYMIQDPLTAVIKGMEPTECFTIKQEPFFLDGPVTRRVAILDFDEDTGELHQGARFISPPPGLKKGHYRIIDEKDFTARDFMQVSVFATVLKTMYMFEEDDALGRELSWAFDGPQLLVVPRAGEWANAYYERESGSLQFFFFPSTRYDNKTVYTALSQDIVAHETGHAILDGIAPDLYNAITPQALAMHEAIADLTALMMALRSRELSERLLGQTNGRIDGSQAFSWLAEEFGYERDATGRASYLRSLWNEKNLNPADDSIDENHQPNQVSRTEPHTLSQVLTGALYRTLVRLHEEYKSEESMRTGRSEFSVSGKALFLAREHFKRLILRALDYLPPGEVSFGDYGRAILAADLVSHPEASLGRDELVNEFVRRYIVGRPGDLEVTTNFEHPAVDELDLDTLVESDWAAYHFANRNRDLLRIPAGVHFRVRPRLKATKTYYLTEGPRPVSECIFKVSWDRSNEQNPQGSRLPNYRQISVGTTLSIDWKTRWIRAILPSHAAIERGQESIDQRIDRDAMITRLLAENKLRIGREPGDDQPGFSEVIRAEASGPLMRIRGAVRMLHSAAEEF
jgi:hypothetical protein